MTPVTCMNETIRLFMGLPDTNIESESTEVSLQVYKLWHFEKYIKNVTLYNAI